MAATPSQLRKDIGDLNRQQAGNQAKLDQARYQHARLSRRTPPDTVALAASNAAIDRTLQAMQRLDRRRNRLQRQLDQIEGESP